MSSRGTTTRPKRNSEPIQPDFSSDSDDSSDLSEDGGEDADEILRNISNAITDSPIKKKSSSRAVVSSDENDSVMDSDNIDVEEDSAGEEEYNDNDLDAVKPTKRSQLNNKKSQKKKNGKKGKNTSKSRAPEVVDESILIGDKTAIEKPISYRYVNDQDLEILVKYKNMSYYHCDWIPYQQALDTIGKTRMKRLTDKPLYEINWSEDEVFNPAYVKIDRVIDEGEMGPGSVYYLVKWGSLAYEFCTWETEEVVEKLNPEKITEFHDRRLMPPEKKNPPKSRPDSKSWTKYQESPIYKHGNNLRKYQLEGLNWLTYCWFNGQSSLLGDEMGLGKTVQSTAFLYDLFKNRGVKGPFLIITPLSTIGNWEREIKTWTDMNVVTYHGSDKSRNLIVNTEFYYRDEKGNNIRNAFKFDIILTTYETALAGTAHLRPIYWRAVVLDEAHRLKNKTSKATEVLKQFQMDHKVLLTGTPLQNSIEELWSLLNFLEPEKFSDLENFNEQFGSMSSAAEVEKLQSLLKPLMLRRLKEDVETSIPLKEETIIEVELTTAQKKWYRSILERNFGWLKQGAGKKNNTPNLINTMMELRKCCIHPFLLKGAEENIMEDLGAKTPEQQFQALIDSSGKMVLLHKLLKKLKEGGHKVLIFSQMTRCLDLIQDYLRGQHYGFERIDGSIRGDLRQASIDRFCAPEAESFVFLLCTRAGGVGINLTVADTVIIFDSDWNPQNDLQAQSRCHRIGQTKQVQIYRLITRNTYEREMFDRASMKLGLDKAILQRMDTGGDGESASADIGGKTLSQLPKGEIEELLKKGAYGAFMDDEASKQFCEEDIDQILERRTQVIKHDQAEQKGSIFSKATFAASTADANIEIDDPNFWDLLAKKAELTIQEESVSDGLIVMEPRLRRQVQRFGAKESDMDLGPDNDDGNATGEKDHEYNPNAWRGSSQRSGLPSQVYQSAPGEEPFKPWTPTEKTRLERALMAYGFGEWHRMLLMFSRRSEMDLKAAARAIVMVLLSRPNVAEYRKDLMQLLELEFPVEASGPDLDIPYPGATQKQIMEFRSFLHDSPDYQEHIIRKAKVLAGRLQMMYFFRKKINLNKQTEMPFIQANTPEKATWWGEDEDRDIILGILKHGYGQYERTRDDPEFCFYKRQFIGVTRNDDTAFDNYNVKDEELEDETIEKQEEQQVVSSPAAPPSEIDAAQPIGSDSIAVPANSDENVPVKWPSASDIGKRVRSIMVGFVRLLDSLGRDMARQELRRQLKEDKSRARTQRTDEMVPSRPCLSRKDKLDFNRILMSFGVETKPGGIRDWKRFKELAKIDKPDELLDEYYLKLITMCAKVIEKAEEAARSGGFLLGDGAAEEEPVETTAAEGEEVPKTPQNQIKIEYDGDTMTFVKAQQMVKRIDEMRRLREEVLVHPQLEQRLALAWKKSKWMPSWWNATYDRYFLEGVSRWGIVHQGQMVQDPELPFKPLHDAYIAKQEAAMEAGRDTSKDEKFWPSDTVARGRLIALGNAVLQGPPKISKRAARRRDLESDDDEEEEINFDDDIHDEMISYKPRNKKLKTEKTKKRKEEGDEVSDNDLAQLMKTIKKKKKKAAQEEEGQARQITQVVPQH